MATTGILVEGYQDRVTVLSGRILFEFFPSRGMYTITLGDQAHVLDHAAVGFREADRAVDSTSYPEVRWRVIDLSDNLGEGKAFIAHFGGKSGLPALTADFSFYEGRDMLAIGVQLDNTIGRQLLLNELSPTSCREKGGKFVFGEPGGCKVLLADWASFGQTEHLCSLGTAAEAAAFNSILFCDTKGKTTLVCGIFEPAKCPTSFHVSRCGTAGDALAFWVRQELLVSGNPSEANSGLAIPEGGTFSPGRIALILDEDPHRALELYAEAVAKVNRITPPERIPCGWVSRSHRVEKTSEGQVLSHAEFIATELRRYGLKDILIDAGWQVSGDWSGGPWVPGESFPNGMKSLVDQVHSRDLNIGIWMRPFDLDGTRLDPSSDFARNFLQKEAAKLTRSWGFDFIKIDFIEWDAFEREDRFLPENSSFTGNQAVRSALQAMRHGIREGAFLLGIGTAPPASLGLVETQGTARDVDATRWQTVRESALKAAALRYHLNRNLWVNDPGYLVIGKPATLSQSRAWASLIALTGGCVFVGDSLLSLSEHKRSIIKRIIPPLGKAARPMDLLDTEHPQIWVLEVEKPFGKWHVVGLFNWDPTPKEIEETYREAVQANIAILKENDKNEGIERSPVAHRKIASDNRLIRRENERIASVLQRSGIAQARLALLHLVKKMRKSPRFRNVKVSFRRLGLDPSISHLVYDFWADHFLGEHRGSLTTLVKLAACRVLAFHPALGRPQLLSTSRHVTQGAIELKDLRWDESRCELKGKSDLVAEDDYRIVVHVPTNYKLVEVQADCSESRADTGPTHLVRLWLKHPRDKTVSWRAKFEKLI
ncbi:MAG: alpha-galactosidase [bacterium]|nr:alpha-galactosidase [bacterium]